jgi:hypothetical protein
MPTVTRLTSNGVFQSLGGFDEISLDSGSINFNGTTDYLSVSNNDSLNMGTSNFTLEAWIYLTATPNNPDANMGAIILDKDAQDSVSWPQYALMVNNSRQVCVSLSSVPTVTPTPTTFITGSTTLALNTWHHVAFTRVGTAGTLYVNGLSNGSTSSIPSTLNGATRSLLIGYSLRNTFNTAYLFPGYMSNIRILKGTALYTANFTPPTAPLTPVSNTSLLLTASPQNPFGDSSSNNFTMTRNGTPRFNSLGPFYYPGNTSINLANTNNNPVLGSNTNIITSTTSNGVVMVTGEFDEVYLSNVATLIANTRNSIYFGTADTTGVTLPSSSSLILSGDFTIESWVYQSTTATKVLLGSNYANTNQQIQFNEGLVVGRTGLYSGSAWQTVLTPGSVSPANTWFHLAYVRRGTTVTVYYNGANTGAFSSATSYNFSGGAVGALKNYDVGGWTRGNIGAFRILNGTGLYTTNFTPSAPLTAIANTVLLTGQYGSIIDRSANNLTLTPYGSPLPTVNTTSFPTDTIGINSNTKMQLANTGIMFIAGEFDEVSMASMSSGSLRFDGSTGYLSVPYSSNFEFGNGNFTIEFWMYSSGISNQGLMSFPHNASNYGQALFFGGGSSSLQFYSSSDGINWDVANASSLGNINLNAWNHIAVSKSGSSIRTFKNGVLQATITFAGTFAGTYDRCWIGDTSLNSHYTGLFSNIRVVKGTALYTANFTPPTSPLTAISGTQLLLNTTTTQPFVDSSSNNLTITVNGGVTSNTFTPFV